MSQSTHHLPLTGGCQCGAIRFACDAPAENIHLCHCRMCQKAVGGPFAQICPVPRSAFRLTRGAFAWFRSSEVARRGFCAACGTPLAFDMVDVDDIGIMGGSFDRPDLMIPQMQCGTESRVGWMTDLDAIPADHPTYTVDPSGYLPRIRRSNRQHPDVDTAVWPPV